MIPSEIIDDLPPDWNDHFFEPSVVQLFLFNAKPLRDSILPPEFLIFLWA
jgi:hypothetical protein